MRTRHFLWAAAGWLITPFGVAAADAPPAWLSSVASSEIPAAAASAPAVVLLDETDVTVDERGVATRRLRHVIRISQLSARDYAAARVAYLGGHDRVEFVRAWVVRNGRVEKFKREGEWADVAEINASTVFGEYRAKAFSAADIVLAGDVFAYEAELRQPLLVAQLLHGWGGTLPVLIQTLRLSLPKAFTIEVRHLRIQPEQTVAADGRETTWTARNLPFHPDEPSAVHPGRINGRTRVRIVPRGGADFKPATLHTWPDVIRWAETLSAGQCDMNPAMQAKVHELTAAATTTLGKIEVLCRYVQNLRYVALDKDLGQGAGYKPRRASQVFAQGYGDCKDKANMLRALLGQVGVTSHVAIAHLGDEHIPSPDFPSPGQFNHAISAVVVDATVDLPSVVQTSAGERVLLFDATHPHVQLGDLPESLQGSRVLLLSPTSEGLLDVPHFPLQTSHRLERVVDVTLQRDGTIRGTIRLSGRGQFAAHWRGVSYHSNESNAYEKAAARTLGDALRDATLSNAAPVQGDVGEYGMSCDIAAPKFLQYLPGNLAVVRLDLLSRAAVPNLSARERTRPVALKPMALDDTVNLGLPEGFEPEELPAPASHQSDYGDYTRTVTFSNGTALLRRQLSIRAMEVPVNEYPQLRKFLSDVAKADRASLLLRMPQSPVR